jgi:hypothetical protein
VSNNVNFSTLDNKVSQMHSVFFFRKNLEQNFRMTFVCMFVGETKSAYKNLVRELSGINHFGNLGVNGMIILKFILQKQGVWTWAGVIWLRIRIMYCDHFLKQHY